jgi:uncharacterized membrane protein YfcA
MIELLTVSDIAFVALLGLIAGVLGGMLGVGGSVVMIPGLVWLLGREHGAEQHLYQAGAMIANVAVSVPAAMRHRQAGAMTPSVLVGMLPAALVCVLIGVGLSNLPIFSGADGSVWLGRCLAVFLIYVIYANTRKLLRSTATADPSTEMTPDPGSARLRPLTGGITVGGIMGSTAGLMGIGGGAIATPLQQTLLGLPLRNCIANSSLVICISATLGAISKNASLSLHATPALPLQWTDGLWLGLLLAPTAWAGGRLGASLTHRLPLRTIRIAFILLMVIAAWKMAAI